MMTSSVTEDSWSQSRLIALKAQISLWRRCRHTIWCARVVFRSVKSHCIQGAVYPRVVAPVANRGIGKRTPLPHVMSLLDYAVTWNFDCFAVIHFDRKILPVRWRFHNETSNLISKVEVFIHTCYRHNFVVWARKFELTLWFESTLVPFLIFDPLTVGFLFSFVCKRELHWNYSWSILFLSDGHLPQ